MIDSRSGSRRAVGALSADFGPSAQVLVDLRYAGVLDVYRDNKRFTSESGNVLATLLQGYDSAARKMVAMTDGIRHRQLRGLM